MLRIRNLWIIFAFLPSCASLSETYQKIETVASKAYEVAKKAEEIAKVAVEKEQALEAKGVALEAKIGPLDINGDGALSGKEIVDAAKRGWKEEIPWEEIAGGIGGVWLLMKRKAIFRRLHEAGREAAGPDQRKGAGVVGTLLLGLLLTCSGVLEAQGPVWFPYAPTGNRVCDPFGRCTDAVSLSTLAQPGTLAALDVFVTVHGGDLTGEFWAFIDLDYNTYPGPCPVPLLYPVEFDTQMLSEDSQIFQVPPIVYAGMAQCGTFNFGPWVQQGGGSAIMVDVIYPPVAIPIAKMFFDANIQMLPAMTVQIHLIGNFSNEIEGSGWIYLTTTCDLDF